MGRRRFSFGRELAKVARSGNGLLKGLNDLAQVSSVDSDTEFERKVRRRSTSPVDSGFYVKLVGVSFSNSDGSSRQRQIRDLEVSEELRLVREPFNVHDPNAVLVCRQNGDPVGHLNRRLAGEVTRSQNKGFRWRCYVRRVARAPGKKFTGVVVFMVKHPGDSGYIPHSVGLSGPEFLARYCPEYIRPPERRREQGIVSTAVLQGGLLLGLAAFLLAIVKSC